MLAAQPHILPRTVPCGPLHARQEQRTCPLLPLGWTVAAASTSLVRMHSTVCAATSTALPSAVSRRRVRGGKAHTPPGRALFMAVFTPPLLPLHMYVYSPKPPWRSCAAPSERTNSLLFWYCLRIPNACLMSLRKTFIHPCLKRRNVFSV